MLTFYLSNNGPPSTGGTQQPTTQTTNRVPQNCWHLYLLMVTVEYSENYSQFQIMAHYSNQFDLKWKKTAFTQCQ